MKKKLVYGFALLLLLPIGATWSIGEWNSIGQWNSSQQQAEQVITRYLDALIQGNTLAISNMLGERLRERHDKTLNNPTYPTMLIKRYANAHYEIIQSEVIDENQVEVDVFMAISDQEIMETKFILRRDSVLTDVHWPVFRIVEERELAD